MIWLERLLGQRHAHPQRSLSAYIDNSLDPAEAIRVEAHLDDCSDCRLEVEGLRAVKAALTALPEPELRRSFLLSASDVAAIGERRRSSSVWNRSYVFARVAGAGVAVILLLILGLDAFSAGTRSTPGMHTYSESKATSNESADRAGERSSASPMPAAAQRSQDSPPSAPALPAGAPETSIFSRTTPTPVATLAPNLRVAPTAEETELSQSAGKAQGVADSTAEEAQTAGFPTIRVIELTLGTVFLVLLAAALYVRSRVNQR